MKLVFNVGGGVYMSNEQNQSGHSVVVRGNIVWIDGVQLPPCPSKGKSVIQMGGNVYIDGYEFKDGKWKKVGKSVSHSLF